MKFNLMENNYDDNEQLNQLELTNQEEIQFRGSQFSIK